MYTFCMYTRESSTTHKILNNGRSWYGSAMTLFDGLFDALVEIYIYIYINIIVDTDVKFWHNLDASLELVLSKSKIDTFDSLETMRFWHRSYFGNFREAFFYHIFRLKGKISNCDCFIGNIWLRSIRIIPIFNLKIYFYIYKINFWLRKGFFCNFFLITSKVQRFWKFWWLHRKNHIKIFQTMYSFYSKKYLK